MTDTDMTFRVKVAMSEAQRDLAAFGQNMRQMGAEARTAMQVAAEGFAGVHAPLASAKESAQAFAAALDMQDRVDNLRAGLDPAYAATMTLTAAEREFTDAKILADNAVEAGALSQAEAAKALDLLAAKHQAAAAAATGMGAATQTAMQLAANSFAGVQAPISSAEQSAKAFAASLDLRDSIDRMRTGLDPAYAATQNVARAQLEFADAKIMADNAVEAGLISQAEAVRMLDLLAAKQRAAADAAVQMGARTSTAMTAMGATNGAVTGNVVAQLNDVWVMAAAGQNPLMTAIQQGTQLSQVFSFMGGGGGAIRTLGAAFASLLSPTTLLTLGLVAGASALIQWGVKAIGAGDGAKTLDDRVKDLSAATRDYISSAKAAATPVEDLKEKYGELADEVQRALEAQRDLAREKAESSLSDVIAASGFDMHGIGRRDAMRAQLDEMRQAMLDTQAALTPTSARFFDFSADYVAMDQLRGQIDAFQADLESAASKYQITISQAEQLAMATEALRQAKSDTDRVESASELLAIMRAVFGSIEAADVKTGGMASALAEAVESGADIATAMKLAGEEADKTAAKVAASYEAELAKQQGLASIRRVIAQYGEDSAQAANAQATAARKAYQAEQEAAGQAGVHLDNLLKAWDAAQGVASVDIAGNVTLAADAAGRMAGNLVASVAALNQLNRQAVMKPLQRQQEAQIDLNTVGRPEERAVQHDVLDYRWSLPDGGYGAIASGVDTSALRLMAAGEEAVRSASAAAAQLEQDATAADAAWTKLTSAGGGSGAAGGGAADKDSLAGLQKEAAETLTGLETNIAAIQEKVAAGLMTTAGAAQAVATAKEQAAGSLAELIAKLEKLGAAGQAAAADIRVQMRGVGADVKAVGADLTKDLSDAFKGPFAAFLAGAQPAKDAMSDFANHVKAKLAEIAAEELQLKVITPVLDKLTSAAGSIFKFADGGAPDGADLAAHRNKVLDSPTLFAMAGGRTGLAGEAGREAIMPIADGGVLAVADGRETRLPLVRGAGGRLGVNLGAFSELIEAYARGGVPDGEAVVGGAGAVRAPWRPTSLDRIVALAAPDLATRLLRAAPMGGGVGAAPRQSAPSTVVNIQPPAGHAAQVAERAVSGGGMSMDVIFEKIDDHIARGLRAGSGSTYSALTDVMGLSRAVR